MNILGIDFEDWFHPELVQRQLKTINNTPKVIKGLEKILSWLRKNECYATFFVVGELLKFKPEIQDKIIEEGHEIGFHTMNHTRLDTPGFKEEFSNEIKEFEKLTSGKSRGFRAPTFSLNATSSWLIDVLIENNYQYDSSVVPVKTSMYGIASAESRPYKISSSSIDRNDPNGKIMEYPLLITSFLGKKIPAGGGFYLRTLPMKIINDAVKRYEKNNIPATFYIHSWELTPEYMPKISLPKKDHFITYHNLEKALPRMEEILKKFEFTSFSRYITKGH